MPLMRGFTWYPAEMCLWTILSGKWQRRIRYSGIRPILPEPEENIRQLYENVMGEYVRSGDSGRGIFFVRRLMEAVYRHMSYVPGATDIHTTAAQALRGGKGVCQDYTHILLSMCRMAGIPARYAAGAMIGEGATHAWAEVWLEGMWLGSGPHQLLYDR